MSCKNTASMHKGHHHNNAIKSLKTEGRKSAAPLSPLSNETSSYTIGCVLPVRTGFWAFQGEESLKTWRTHTPSSQRNAPSHKLSVQVQGVDPQGSCSLGNGSITSSCLIALQWHRSSARTFCDDIIRLITSSADTRHSLPHLCEAVLTLVWNTLK